MRAPVRQPRLRDRQARESLRRGARAPTRSTPIERAYETDPTSAFGGIIAFNRPLDAATAAAILERQFVEVILAPAIDPEARAVLAAKPNIRALETGDLAVRRRGRTRTALGDRRPAAAVAATTA